MAAKQRKRNVTDKRALEYESDGRLDATGRVVGRKPTEAYLNSLLRQGWAEQQAQRNVDEEMETLLQDFHDLDLPDLGIESERITGSRAMELVLQVSQFWPQRPDISIPPLTGAGDEYAGFSDDLEAALNALIANQEKAVRGPRGPFWDSIRKYVCAYGRAYGVLLPNPRSWRDYPEPSGDLADPEAAKEYTREVDRYSRGKLPPLRLEAVSPRRVLPFNDGDGLAEAFWITYDRAWEVLLRCKNAGKEPPRFLAWLDDNPDERLAVRIPVIHYANRTWCAELLGTPQSYPPEEERVEWIEDCDLLDVYPHWLEDRIPVAYFSGLTTPLSEDHKAVVGVAYQVRNLIYSLDRLDSMKGTAVRTWAWPTPVLKTSLVRAELIEAGDDGRPRPIEIAPGLTVTLWGDEDLAFLTYQGDGPDTELQIGRLEQRFQQLSLPSAESQAGDVSGYLYAQMRKSVRGKWGSISDGLARGWEDLAWIELEYLRRMPGPIYIPSVDEIGWADMGIYANSEVKRRGTVIKLDPKKLQKFNPFLHVAVEEDRTLDLVANIQAAQGAIAIGVPKAIVYPEMLGLRNYKMIRILSYLEKLDEFPGYIEQVLGTALKQGQLFLEDKAEGAAGAIDPGQLSPGMLQAMQAMGMAQGGAPGGPVPGMMQPGQMGNAAIGAMQNGGMPPGMLPMPTPGGALPGGGMGGMPVGGGAMPPMGGFPSPAVMAAPPAPRPIRGGTRTGGRAPGQSRRPGGPNYG